MSKPRIPRAGAQFGYAVALSSDGRTLAVGAQMEESAATGVNGNQNDQLSVQRRRGVRLTPNRRSVVAAGLHQGLESGLRTTSSGSPSR